MNNTAQHQGIYLGLMSGTSADGLDIAICDIQAINKVSLINSYYSPYPDKLRQRVIEAQISLQPAPEELQELDMQLADFVSEHIEEAIRQNSLCRESIIAIANHGQTIQHCPNAVEPYSLQLGNAQLIANQTGLKVIADFRRADIENGGQGAPLMPAFHQHAFSHRAPCNIVNIGGIANITALEKSPENTIGYDTGPGNTLMNYWISKHQGLSYDNNGNWARTGKQHTELLHDFLADPFFSLPQPKSTGQDYFNPEWLHSITRHYPDCTAEDVQYTLTLLTATTIGDELQRQKRDKHPVYLCGGGVHNTLLTEMLGVRLPNTMIETTQAVGIDPDWVEAMGFAWLGFCRLNKLPGNMPMVTGSRETVVLGDVLSPTTI